MGIGCFQYDYLWSPHRKTDNMAGNYFSIRRDNVKSYRVAPDWKGAGWYRISEKIGSRIPSSPRKSGQCGTFSSGWINGTHPTIVGETYTNVDICFNKNCGYGYRESHNGIRNCGSFFLYYLRGRSLGTYCVE